MVFWEFKTLHQKKKYFCRRFKKFRCNYYYDKFSSNRRLLKANIQCDKLNRFKSTDNNLKTNPMHFWKYVPSFRKNYKNPIEPKTDGNRLTHPRQAAEVFGVYFQRAFNNHRLRDFSTDFQSSDSLSAASICDSDVFNAIRRVRPSKSVGLDGIPALIIQVFSDILIHVLNFIFKLNSSQWTFSTIWKQNAIVFIKKRKEKKKRKYCLREQLQTNFYIQYLFQNILNYHTWERSTPFEAQFNPRQLGFIKSKSSSTNPIAYMDSPGSYPASGSCHSFRY